MVLKFTYLFLALICSFLVGRLLWQFTAKLRLVSTHLEESGVKRWEYTSKPLVGGIALYITFLLFALLHSLFYPTDASGMVTFLAPLALGTMGFFIGLLDDAFTSGPLTKFSGQIGCALVILAMGQGINLFHIPILDGALTIFWVVGIMNSLNMLDNMDGVTGSVSCVILTAIFFIARSAGHGEDLSSYVMVALVGGLLGYLILNWYPSKIYMGDSGSQFLGALLACWGIQYVWNFEQISFLTLSLFQPWFAAILVFAPTIMDTSFVTVNRILKGRSPAKGGRDHTTHHLQYYGVPTIIIPIIFVAYGIITGTGAIYLLNISKWSNWIHLPFVLLFIFSSALLMLYFYIKGGVATLSQPKEQINGSTAEQLDTSTTF